VLLGVLPESVHQLVDAQICVVDLLRESSAGGFPLGEPAPVLGAAFLAAVLPEQEITTAAEAIGDGDNCLTGVLVSTIGRIAPERAVGHGGYPSAEHSAHFRVSGRAANRWKVRLNYVRLVTWVRVSEGIRTPDIQSHSLAL
jgi:hypothetical protein